MQKSNMELANKQKENLSRAFFNAANLILGIVILGQFVAKNGIELGKVLMSVIIYALCIIAGTALDKGGV